MMNSYSKEQKMIKEFSGKYSFLSNFHPSLITIDGIDFPTVEHAYQAAKTDDKEIKQQIANKETPGRAKRAGGSRGVIKDLDHKDWERKKIAVMERLLRIKFQDLTFAAQLKETGDQEIEEGNVWGDTFWGVCLKTGTGQNHLGKLLMKIRSEI
jgi:ribA/ribD-fused uncharacterized protein